MTRGGALLLGCLLAAGGAAQRAVVPPWCARAEGDAADMEPFGRDHVRHVHYIGRGLLRAVPPGARLRAIAYRRDGGRTRPAVLRRVLPGGRRPRPIWTVRMAGFDGDVLAVGGSYPPIAGGRFAIVFGPKPVDFPDLAPPAAGPAPFAIRFALDRPFPYAGAHLAIEHASYVFRKTYYAYAIDAVRQGSGAGSVRPGGTRPRTPPFAGGAAGGPGHPLDLYLHGAPALAFARLHLAPPAAALAVRADARGFAALRLRVPLDRACAGRSFTAEWNLPGACGAVVRRSRIVLGTAPRPAVEMATVSGFADAHVPRGYVHHGHGPVVELRW